MLDVTKRDSYMVVTYDVNMVIGSGETEEQALKEYIESANNLIKKTEIELEKLKDNVKEANSILKNK